MILFRKIFNNITITTLLLMISALPASAWQFKMSNVDGFLTAGEAYTMSVAFEGNETDFLDLLSFSIEWKTSLLEITDYPDVAQYTRGAGLNKYSLWEKSSFDSISDLNNGRWYEISGETDIDHMGEFYPEASGETLMATFTFQALVSGFYEDLAHFYFIPKNELVTINDISYSAEDGELTIYKEGASSIMTVSSVPVPASVWLLGSGLMALVGWKRKK